MMRKVLPGLIVLALAVTGCVLPISITPTATPTNTFIPATPDLQTATQPAPSDTPIPSVTPAPTLEPTPTAAVFPAPDLSNNVYIDDRSTASQVIVSFFNAINRREYARAYGYWRNPSDALGPFDDFVDGYSDTASVELVFGRVSGDIGAGQINDSVPVILKVRNADDSRTNYAACYILRMSQPGNFGAPPITPRGIVQGQAVETDLNIADDVVLSTACSGLPSGGNLYDPGGTDLDIRVENFLDNRSDPIATVSSYLNSLNRREYVRAYSYFFAPTTYPGAYEPYAAGFSETDSITATFGSVQSEGAAGSTYYRVPLAMEVTTTANTQQRFVGCYTLRLVNPANYGAPPVQPMGITAGTFTSMSTNADLSTLLATACP